MVGDNSVEPRDQIEDDERQRHESTTEGDVTNGEPQAGRASPGDGSADPGESQRAEHHPIG